PRQDVGGKAGRGSGRAGEIAGRRRTGGRQRDPEVLEERGIAHVARRRGAEPVAEPPELAALARIYKRVQRDASGEAFLDRGVEDRTVVGEQARLPGCARRVDGGVLESLHEIPGDRVELGLRRWGEVIPDRDESAERPATEGAGIR